MIHHAYSHYVPANPNTMRRMQLAMLTWSRQMWNDLPIPENAGRLFTDRAGRVPYIKDLLSIAIGGKPDNDIVVFTNADICVHSNCANILVGALQAADAVYAFRRDFPFLNTPLPDPIIASGTDYIGCDLFAFRVYWWKDYQDTFPDMLLGREAWDCVMRLLMDWHQDGERPAIPNIIYHERHPTAWENPAFRHQLPSQLHNLNLAKSWLRHYKLDYSRFGIK